MGPESGGLNPEKVRAQKGGARRVRARRMWAPKRWMGGREEEEEGPTTSRFLSPRPSRISFFLISLGGLLVELWTRSALLGFSGSFGASPDGLHAARVSHHDLREPKRAFGVVHGLELRPK